MTDTVQGAAPASAARVSDTYRWTQLAIGVLAMVMIANYQYGWTFFVPDIQQKFGWDRAAIQWAFTLFVLFETWLVPIEGWFNDRYPRRSNLPGDPSKSRILAYHRGHHSLRNSPIAHNEIPLAFQHFRS